ncbi:MAG: 30S ribosomal protein S6e [Candidatus Ranarchaeia archaeon]
MPTFKLVVSDPKTGKSERIELKDAKARPLIGMKIGEVFEGELVGISGTSLKLSGGSDKDGFPMRKDIHGGVRKRVLVGKGLGFKPKQKGQKKRKIFRGDTISQDIVQINLLKVALVVKPKKPAAKKVPKETESETPKKKKEAKKLAAKKPVKKETKSKAKPKPKAKAESKTVKPKKKSEGKK